MGNERVRHAVPLQVLTFTPVRPCKQGLLYWRMIEDNSVKRITIVSDSYDNNAYPVVLFTLANNSSSNPQNHVGFWAKSSSSLALNPSYVSGSWVLPCTGSVFLQTSLTHTLTLTLTES